MRTSMMDGGRDAAAQSGRCADPHALGCGRFAPFAPFARFAPAAVVPLAVALSLSGCGGSSNNDGFQPLQIKTLSNRADLVSGGDALLEVVMPAASPASSLQVRVNGVDQSSAFARRADGRVTGVVTGLVPGSNTVEARADAARLSRLTITNASRGGPVFSGTQIVPFFCATPAPQGATATTPATNASGLGTQPTDAQCSIATEYKLYYRTTAAGCSTALPDPSPTVAFGNSSPPASATPPANPCFKPYTVGAAAPGDMATVTTDQGVQVPYIVRVERGTMNRGIYDIAVLFDPARPWTATAPQPQWNGKLLYQFGASTGQPRRQFRPATAWSASDSALALGYMVAMNSMTDSAINSNRVMMTETMMMMKEHIGDTYGPIRFTMGNGCSGGSINSNMNASIQPGLVDGITISCAYPDSETTAIEVGDCVLLVEAYQKPQWAALMTSLTPADINAKKAAINGHPDQTGCHGWYNAFGSNSKVGNYVQRLVIDNATGAIAAPGAQTNNCQLPAGLVYDPATNPGGARCSAWDWAASIFGKAPGNIRAFDTRDNVGVQYGLGALLSGAITGEEFVTLNEIVGGNDKDSELAAARAVADPQALSVAYRAGIVMSGRNLAKTAVIDMRNWDDSGLITQPGTAAPSQIPIHYVWRSFSIRDRLDREFGDHGNQVIWRFGRGGLVSPVLAPQAFTTMDQWLTTLKADTGSTAIEQKVRASKPAAAIDFCLLSTDVAQSTRVTDPAVCDADPFLKASSSPRRVAGGPLTENILKCQLKPVDAADYGGRLDAGQLARLQAVFGTGVCDWSKPGVGQEAAVSPLNFSAGAGGQPFPTAPVSTD
ncbi:MAG TPA: DUF6351 family protein [Burkholderiaceae bacterium]|nr:DUF6351 family protein [Burkholderiaceae bacterium]